MKPALSIYSHLKDQVSVYNCFMSFVFGHGKESRVFAEHRWHGGVVAYNHGPINHALYNLAGMSCVVIPKGIESWSSIGAVSDIPIQEVFVRAVHDLQQGAARILEGVVSQTGCFSQGCIEFVVVHTFPGSNWVCSVSVQFRNITRYPWK